MSETDRVKGLMIEIGGNVTGLKKALADVDKSLKNTQTSLKDVNRLLKLDPKNTELLAQKQELLKKAIGETKDRLAALKQAEAQAQQQFREGKVSEEQYNNLKREIIDTENKLKSLEKEAKQTNSTLAKIGQVGDKLKSAGTKISDTGKKLLPVTAAVAAIGTAAVKTTADFDTSMSKVKAISGATGADFEKLRDKAREMGSKTKFSASEAADAMSYMAMAGWKTQDMLDGLEGIMNLAAASGEDLATTSDIVTDALTAFGLTSKDSAHFADILAAASSNANTNVSMMGETFKYCAPIAGALGFSAEDTAEAIGLMANAGIKSTQAGTALRTIMNNLAGEIEISGKELGKVTIQTTNADGSMRSLSDILGDCRSAFSRLSESEKANTASALVGKNAMSGFLALMNASQSDVDKLSNAIANCDGTTQKMADDMQNNLNGQLTILKSALQELAIKIGDILMPVIRQITEKVQDFIDKLNGMSETQQKAIVIIGLVAAAIGPLLIVIGKVTSGVGTVMSLLPKLGALIGSISAPVLAVAAAVAVLVAAFAHLWQTNDEFKATIIGIWNDIVEKFNEHAEKIVALFQDMGFDVKDFGDVMSTVWNGICEMLGPLIEGIVRFLTEQMSFIIGIFGGLVDFIRGLINGDISMMFEGLKEILTAPFEYLWSFVQNIFTVFGDLVNVVLGWFGTSWQECLQGVADFFVNIWNSICSFFSGICESIGGFFVSAWEGIKAVWNTVAEWFSNYVIEPIKAFFSPIVEWFSNLFMSIYNTLKTIIDNVIIIVKGCWEIIAKVWEVVSTWFYDNVINPVCDAFKWLWDKVVGFFQGLWNGIVNIFTGAYNWFKSTVVDPICNVFSNAWQKLKDGASAAWNGIKNVFSKVADFFKNIFTNAWNAVKNVFSTGGKIFSGIKDGIVSAFKKIVNAIIKGINKVVSIPFNAINSAINGIKNVNILGLQPFKGLSTISVPQIPLLAKGGNVYSGSAIVGEKGPELLTVMNGKTRVTPLTNSERASAFMGGEIKVIVENFNNYDTDVDLPKLTNKIDTLLGMKYSRRAF